MDIEVSKHEEISKENQQLKEKLIEMERNYNQIQYYFRKVLIDQKYLLSIISTENEQFTKDRPQIARISDDTKNFLTAIENKTGKFYHKTHFITKIQVIPNFLMISLCNFLKFHNFDKLVYFN